MTRGFAAMSHGRFDDASRYNPAAAIVYAVWWLGTATAAAIAIRGAIRYAHARRGSAPSTVSETLA